MFFFALLIDEGTEDIKMGTSVKHCCQLEEYVVNQQAGGPPLSSTKDPRVKTWSTGSFIPTIYHYVICKYLTINLIQRA